MATAESLRGFAKNYLSVVCPCGRSLRAKLELAGSEIACWECHQMVRVPLPRATKGETARSFGLGWAETFSGEWFLVTLIAAAVVTAALSVPRVGLAAGVVVLGVLGLGYIRLLERPARFSLELGMADSATPRRASFAHGIGALVFGLTLSLPVLLHPSTFGQTVRIGWLGWLLLGAAAVCVPLGLASFFVRDETKTALGLKRIIRAARAHPVAALAAITAVPAAVVFGEFLLFALATFYDCLGVFLGELFPDGMAAARRFDLPQYFLFTPGVSGTAVVFRIYASELSHGYSLLGAIIPSLSHWSIDTVFTAGFVLRLVLTGLTAMIVLLALSLQARWLRTLPMLDSGRAAA